MSREFGECTGGYFHDKIDYALNDLKDSSHIELHKKLIPFFESLYKVAYQISSVEAADSGEQASVDALMEQILELSEMARVDNQGDLVRSLSDGVLERR
jgi:hypothetical protein